jgi:type I restriction enzyme S subunit
MVCFLKAKFRDFGDAQTLGTTEPDMSEWKEYKLAEVAEVIGGFAFKSSEFGDRGLPVVKIKDIVPPNVDVRGCEKVDVSAYDDSRLEKYKLKKGDYLVAMTGATIGKVGRIREEFEGYLNQRVARIRANSQVADNDFIYFCVSHPEFQDFVVNAASGSSVQENASAEDIGSYELFLPPLPEQRAIASVLSSLDDKIDLLHRQNKTLEALAETLFRQWFVEEAERKILLGEIAEVATGKGLKREEFVDEGGYPVLGANGEIGRARNYLTDDRLILTGRVGTLGKVYISEGRVWISDNVLIVRPIADKYFYPIYFGFKSLDFENLNVGSTQPLVTQTDLKNIEVTLPNDETLKDYFSHCKGYFDKISKNQVHIRALTQMRDTLLPKLMSREVRVRV